MHQCNCFTPVALILISEVNIFIPSGVPSSFKTSSMLLKKAHIGMTWRNISTLSACCIFGSTSMVLWFSCKPFLFDKRLWCLTISYTESNELSWFWRAYLPRSQSAMMQCTICDVRDLSASRQARTRWVPWDTTACNNRTSNLSTFWNTSHFETWLFCFSPWLSMNWTGLRHTNRLNPWFLSLGSRNINTQLLDSINNIDQYRIYHIYKKTKHTGPPLTFHPFEKWPPRNSAASSPATRPWSRSPWLLVAKRHRSNGQMAYTRYRFNK